MARYLLVPAVPALLIGLLVAGCEAADPRPENPGTPPAADATAPESGEPAFGERWHRGVALRDLTGDGAADSLVLEASGDDLDSLQIRFRISSGGDTLYEESWESAWYFVYDGPLDSIPEQAKRDRITARLDEFFDDDRFEPLQDPDAPGAPAQSEPPVVHISAGLRETAVRDSLVAAGVDTVTARQRALNEAYRAPQHPDAEGTWRAMVERRPLSFTFFSGGEFTRTIAWSERHARFFTTDACC